MKNAACSRALALPSEQHHPQPPRRSFLILQRGHHVVRARCCSRPNMRSQGSHGARQSERYSSLSCPYRSTRRLNGQFDIRVNLQPEFHDVAPFVNRSFLQTRRPDEATAHEHGIDVTDFRSFNYWTEVHI